MSWFRDATGKISLKYVSLVVLCVQNSTLAILMRLTQVSTGEGGEPVPKFNMSTAVITAEVFKVLACIGLVIQANMGAEAGKKVSNVQAVLNTINEPKELLKIAVPACLYLLQNNLTYVSIANLDAATFQVMYQLKILTTALFSVTMLGKKIIMYQWIAIVVLMIGVAVVQIQEASSRPTSKGSVQGQSTFVGLMSVLLACTCSGFAGVYFEKILKNSGSKVTLWERNIQMGTISAILGSLALVSSDMSSISENGFFYGYRPIVWSAIAVNAFGGLLTAVVVKYADNILKAFATSIAIILSCILSFFLFGKVPTVVFVIGAILVNTSVYVYGVSPSWAEGKVEKVYIKNETGIQDSNKVDEEWSKVPLKSVEV